MKSLVTICRLLGKLGSNNDSEKVAAANLVHQQLTKSKLSWFDLAGINDKGEPTRSNVVSIDNGKFTKEQAEQIYWAGYDDGHKAGAEMVAPLAKKKLQAHHNLNVVVMINYCNHNPMHLTAMDKELLGTFDDWSARNPSPMQYRELVLTYSRVKQATRLANKTNATTRKQRRA